jgi:hypothetical protein
MSMEIIWGIQLKEIILLAKQIGLAVVGAASLWGFILSIRDVRLKKSKSWVVDDWLGMKLFHLILAGTFLAAAAYFALAPVIKAYAHEGISVLPTVPEIIAAFPAMNALFLLLVTAVVGMALLRIFNEEKFSYLITPFYALAFGAAFVMTSLSGWRGTFDSIQIFHFMHGFHSIFTLGSVIVLDFLFIISARSELLKQHVYSLFSPISKVIWTGLSIDFVSVFLITDHFAPSEKFLFIQTVIAVLIINGAILSGPIARKMTDSIKSDGPIEARWRRAGNIAGALSITSWFTITALDFFEGISLNYGELALLYLSAFALAALGHFVFESRESQKEDFQRAG